MRDSEHRPFVAALHAPAAATRAAGVPVTELLRAADSLTWAAAGREPDLA